MNPLRVGIAGFGLVGQRRRDCISRNQNMTLVAVCDKYFQGEGVLPDGVRYYDNYQKLLQESLDVLIVCLTNDIAAEVSIQGLDCGFHVFCEKPPGRTVADLKRVIAKEREKEGLKLMYGFNHRHHDSVVDALKILHSGELGKVINLRGLYGKAKLVTFNQSDWRTKYSIAGGGILLDQGIHMLDLMRLFGGEFSEVHSFISNKFWGYDVEDNAYALLRGSSGVVGMLNSSATQWRHQFSLDINLEQGSLNLGGILSGTKSYGSETLTVVRSEPDSDNGDPREWITRYNKDPSWDREISIFSDCVLNNKPITNGTSGDALKTMQLLFKIYQSDHLWPGYQE
jgi:predicted dehydrogenase